MARRRNVAMRVQARGVPDGLVALHREQALVGPDGRAKVRGPGPNGPRQLFLAADEPTGTLRDGVSHGEARVVLAATEGRRNDPDRPLDDAAAVVLARAGLLRLRAPASKEGSAVVVGDWRAWERTPEGARWAETYDAVDLADPAVAHAVALADRARHGDAALWLEDVEAEVDRVAGLCRRAAELVDDGRAHGWTVARFAEEVTGDPHGLDDGVVAELVVASLARSLGQAETPRTAGERAALLAAAGIGASSLAATVAAFRLPGGAGAVGALLGAAVAHDVPVLLQRSLLTDSSSRPVAPPRAISTVFAVQHAATLEAAAERPGSTPVVVHGGSPAAVPLLEQAMRSGWRVVVSSSADPASRDRQRWLVDRLGDTAVAWRANGDAAAAPDETDALADLLGDITAGRVG